MSKKQTDVTDSLDDRERIEFEELNRYLRLLCNEVWLVSSIFFTINALALKLVVGILENNPAFLLIVSFIFIVQWILTIIFVARAILNSFYIVRRIRELNPYWDSFLQSLTEPIIMKSVNKKSLLSKAILTPWGLLIIPLGSLLAFVWGILLIHCFLSLWLSYLARLLILC